MISFADATLRNQPRGVASYYDMLGEQAFGNFRDLLEGVTLSPDDGRLPLAPEATRRKTRRPAAFPT